MPVLNNYHTFKRNLREKNATFSCNKNIFYHISFIDGANNVLNTKKVTTM